MQILKKLFFNFILPVLIIITAFTYNIFAGIVAAAAYVIYVLYAGRIMFYALMGNLNYSKGSLDLAAVWLEKAYKSSKAKPQIIISYGYLLLKLGRVEESEEIFVKLLDAKLDEDCKMLAKSNYALVLWKKGKLDEAITLLEEVYSSFKTSNIYGSLGYLLILKGDLKKALDFNLEAHGYNSTNQVIQDNLGQNYYLMGDYDKAEEVYNRLIPTNPTFPEAYYNYGLVLVGKNDYNKALDCFNRALKFKFTFLSTVAKLQIEEKAAEVSKLFEAQSIGE